MRLINIGGIDLGNGTSGYGVITADLNTGEIIKVKAVPIKLEPLSRILIQSADGVMRLDKLWAYRQHLESLLHRDNIEVIGVEEPFMNKYTASAFGPLRELLLVTKYAIWSLPSTTVYKGISPMEVKKRVGVIADYHDKDRVRTGVIALGLPYVGDVPLSHLDNNAIDSIGVAYCTYQDYFAKLKPKGTLCKLHPN